MNDRLKQDRITRRDKLAAMGIDPHGVRFPNAASCADVRADFEAQDGKEGIHAIVAGRIIGYRRQGKSAFVDVQDRSGRIQIYMQRDRVGEQPYEVFKLLQAGDIIGVEGELTTTRSGELTIFVDKFEVLCKSLKAPPEKWHGLQDMELRYRRRYVDLFANPEVSQVFILRARVTQWIRDFLNKRCFIEVETPMMHHLAGGAAARPFTTHHNALDLDLYLRIAPELYLKRLLVGGLERVYEINRNFRNEGISLKHNPEFTMIELYWAYADYHDNMDLIEEMLNTLVCEILGNEEIAFKDMTLNFNKPWPRKPYLELITEHAEIDAYDEDAVKEKVRVLDCETEGLDHWEMVDEIFSKLVEPNLIDPTFVIDYPAHTCPLARRIRENPELTERFELFVAGMEIANAYSELNDPEEQMARFKTQVETKGEGEIDIDYVEALEYGMPPASGLGMGIDRLIMILADVHSIRDVILFPLLRPHKE